MDLKNKPRELFELNPYGKVPVLVDGEGVIYESAIINEYLDERYPTVPLMPHDPLLRSRARIWIDFANTRLQRAAGYVAHGYQVERSRQEVQEFLHGLNAEMRDRVYIAGDYSLADITFIPFFCRLERYQTTIGDDLPHVRRWMARLLDRPAVRRTP